MRQHMINGIPSAIIGMGLIVMSWFFLNKITTGVDGLVHFSRPAMAALVLLVFVLFREKVDLKPSKNDLMWYLLAGFCLAIAMFTFNLVITSVSLGSVAVVSTVFTTISVILLSRIFLKEKVTKRETVAMLVAGVGFLLINPLNLVPLNYLLILMIGNLAFAFMVVIIRKEEHNHGIGIAFWYLLFASLFLSPLLAFTNFDALVVDWFPMIMVGIFSGLAYLYKDYAFKFVKADLVQITESIFGPLFSIIVGLLFLSQVPTLVTLVGFVILIISVMILSKELFQKSQ